MTGQALRTVRVPLGPGEVNTPADQDMITHRLHRLIGLTDNQIQTLAQTLDADQVEQINDADLAALANGTLPGLPTNPNQGLPLGMPGALAATRWVGGTNSGAPSTGAFLVGDFVIARNGALWICTAAGSPGTWTAATGAAAAQLTFTAVKTGSYTAAAGEVVLCNTTSGSFAVTLPNLSANSLIRVKWRTGTLAPTVVAGASATLDTAWPGFGALGDSADFAYDGSIWNYL